MKFSLTSLFQTLFFVLLQCSEKKGGKFTKKDCKEKGCIFQKRGTKRTTLKKKENLFNKEKKKKNRNHVQREEIRKQRKERKNRKKKNNNKNWKNEKVIKKSTKEIQKTKKNWKDKKVMCGKTSPQSHPTYHNFSYLMTSYDKPW